MSERDWDEELNSGEEWYEHYDRDDFNETCNGAGNHKNCVKCPRCMDGLGCAPDPPEFALKTEENQH